MKRAILLLSGSLLLAGCGGYQYKAHQNFLSPAPDSLLQDLSLFALAQDEAPPDRVSKPPISLAAIAQGVPVPVPETEIHVCYPNALIMTFGGEEMVPTGWSFLSADSGSSADPGAPAAVNSSAETAAIGQRAETEQGPGNSSSGAASRRPAQQEEGKAFAAKSAFMEAPALATLQGSDGAGPASALPWEMEPILDALFGKEKTVEKPLAGSGLSSKILGGIPALLNDRVKGFIDFFQYRADSFFTKSLARSQAYEGMMKQIFREKNLPEELFYLALIESGYNPQAESRAKALGIWQFMSKTAKRFGLKVDKWVDERRDPEKSTYAAAEYLKSLYEMFNCWHLAAASYNAGEGKMLQAMKKAKSQDFWEISKHRYLKRETKEYVPQFLAAMIIAQDPQKYGFSNIAYHPPLTYEKVIVPPGTRLDRIARAAETDVENIRTLNPSLRKDLTPPEGASFEIKIPAGKREVFEENFSRMKIFDPRVSRKHQVHRGETLGQIAKKYRIDLQELCEGNQITPKTPIRPGTTLLLPPL